MFFETNHLEDIAKHLNVMQHDLHLLAQGDQRLQVVTETRRELEQRREEVRGAYENQSSGISGVSHADDDQE